jgi:hypothetical protein
VSFGPADDRWYVSAFVHNIEDDRVIRGMLIHPITNFAGVQVSEPRLYGVRASLTF